MTKVLLFIPTISGSIPVATVSVLMRLENRGIQVELKTTSRMLIHSARNFAIECMAKGDYDYLLFLDDDNPPYYNDFIPRLVSHEKDIVCGFYRLRTNQDSLSIYKGELGQDDIKKYVAYKNIKTKRPDLFEVDGCGTGCCLLSRKVCLDMYERYDQRPFESKYVKYIRTKEVQPTGMPYVEDGIGNYITYAPDDSQGKIVVRSRELSEDLLFMERAMQHGYKIYCDTKLKVYHLGKDKTIEI